MAEHGARNLWTDIVKSGVVYIMDILHESHQRGQDILEGAMQHLNAAVHLGKTLDVCMAWSLFHRHGHQEDTLPAGFGEFFRWEVWQDWQVKFHCSNKTRKC